MSENQDQTASEVLKVIIYSSDRLVREQIRLALGRKIAPDLPEVEITEFATGPALIEALDNDSFDVAVVRATAAELGTDLGRLDPLVDAGLGR